MAAEKKNKGGRPKKGLDDLPKDWQKIVLDLACQGASDVEMRVALNAMSDDLWYRLIEEEPEFSRTIKKAKLISQVWWERSGRTNLENKDFSFTGWYMNMKNRFKWTDRQEVDNTHQVKLPMIFYPEKKAPGAK